MSEKYHVADSAYMDVGLKKRSKAQTFGAVIGNLLGCVTQGAAYALGALLVWELFFR